MFDIDYYEASIKEDAYFNTPVVTVHASDNDDNIIEYFMVKNHENSFSIDSKTGVIKLNRKLDYELQSVYTIEVGAKDDKHMSTVPVKILIINVIDRAPDFEQVYYNFKIKSPNDVYLGKVRAIDIENTGHVSYSLEDFPNKNDSKPFCISKTGGVVYICSQYKTQLYKIGDNSETIDGNIFSKSEYVFFVQASIPVNETYNLAHKVECRVQIEFKILAEAPSLSISDREIIFKDPNTFYAFLAAIGGISIVMITSIIIMVWYKCQGKNGRNASNLYKNTANTISSDSSRSFRSTLNNSYTNGSKSIKKASTNLDKTIISQWEDKGINGIFYGTDDLNKVDLEVQDKKDGSKKSSSIYSGKRRKSKKSLSRSLSSASSTSIPITSSSRTQTPSFSSLGVLASLAVDNTIIEEYPPKEPLTMNYETSMNTGEDIQMPTSIYKCELIVPEIKYSPNDDEKIKVMAGDASFNVDESTLNEESKYQQVTQKLNHIITELSKRNLNTFNKTHALTKIAPNNCTIYSSSSSNQTLINKNIECEFFFGNDNFS